MVSSAARSAATRLSPRRSEASHRPNGRFLLIAALMIAIPGVISAQQMPNSDHCNAPDAKSQTEGGQTAPRSQDSAGQKLSNCDGVLKPPATGDSAMEKPAPRGGKTRLYRPATCRTSKEAIHRKPSKSAVMLLWLRFRLLDGLLGDCRILIVSAHERFDDDDAEDRGHHQPENDD